MVIVALFGDPGYLSACASEIPVAYAETNDENTKYSARYSGLFFMGTGMTSFL
jgi:hypothetical protein